jgi:hypothetical protein
MCQDPEAALAGFLKRETSFQAIAVQIDWQQSQTMMGGTRRRKMTGRPAVAPLMPFDRHPAFQPFEQERDTACNQHIDHREQQQRFIDDERVLAHA